MPTPGNRRRGESDLTQAIFHLPQEENTMVPTIGNFSSIAPVASASTQAAAAVQSPAAAASQVVKDSLNISQQGQAASAKLDSDGDHDGS
jgi:hypothetical protein